MIRVLVFMRMGPGIGLNWNTIAAVAILLNLTGHFCTAAFLVCPTSHWLNTTHS